MNTHIIRLAPLPAMLAAVSGHAAVPADYRGLPFDDAAYRIEQKAAADRPTLPFHAFTNALNVWNGTNATNGSGWTVEGGPAASARIDETDSDGRRVLHFHAATPNYRYAAFGWNWASPQQPAVKLGNYGAVSFSIKVTGPKRMQELFFGLGDDQASAVSIRPFLPAFDDGSWHRVTIPLRALAPAHAPAAVPAEARGFALKTFVWNPSDFDVLVDNVGFDAGTDANTGVREPIATESGPRPGQAIPGRIECAFYDLGGEGVAYHDTTPVNTLSAVLNQQANHRRPHATAYHWEFRRDEAVDISFAKDFADLNHTNRFDPPINQLYVGSTEDGEWCNYTVEVARAGTYRIVALYGNVAGAKPLRFSVDGRPAAECPCPVVTGGMHNWTRETIGTLEFAEPGTHLLTLRYERGYNLARFDFEAL